MNNLPQFRQRKILQTSSTTAINRIIEKNKRNLDQICNTTAKIYDTEECSIGILLNNNIHIKSQKGTLPSVVNNKNSISIHIIRAGQALVVTNLMRDKRFENNPYVKGDTHLRFYAGVPLKARHQDVFGMIAIYSRRARDFDPDKLRTLEIISHQVEELINDELELESVQDQQYITHGEPAISTIIHAKPVERPERRAMLDFDEHRAHLTANGVCSKFEFLQSVERAIELSLVRSRCAGVIAVRLRSRGRQLSLKQTLAFDGIIGALIPKHFRKTDVIGCVGPGQYALLVPLLHERRNLTMLADRIHALLTSEIDAQLFPEMRFQVRAAMYPIDGYDGAELLATGFAS